MHLKRCNGCLTELTDRWTKRGDTVVFFEGTRVDGMSGSGGIGLPNTGETIHWCERCASIAFKAVDDATAP